MKNSMKLVAMFCIASLIGLSVSCSSSDPILQPDIEVPADQAAALIGLILTDAGEFVFGLSQVLAAYVQGPVPGVSRGTECTDLPGFGGGTLCMDPGTGIACQDPVNPLLADFIFDGCVVDGDAIDGVIQVTSDMAGTVFTLDFDLVLDGEIVSDTLGINIPGIGCPSISFQGFTIDTDFYTASLYAGNLLACPEPALRGIPTDSVSMAVNAPGLEPFYACMDIAGAAAFGVAASDANCQNPFYECAINFDIPEKSVCTEFILKG
jgi:hypothetical protein